VTTRPGAAVNGKRNRPSASASALTGPTIRRHRLGAELRRLREKGGLRLEDTAAMLGVAPSTVSRIETGKAPARTAYVNLMLDFYGMEDPQHRRYLADLAREGQRKGWWASFDDLLPHGAGDYLGLEGDARKVRTFAVQAIPGLLQTAGYAGAVVRANRPGLSTEQANSLIAVTMRRQELARGRSELHAVIDESALLRMFGSAEVMAAQLDRLASAAADPLMTVQVLRFASRQVLSPGFTILSFADDADIDVGCGSGSDEQVTVTSDSDQVGRLLATFVQVAAYADSAADSARLIGQLRKRYAGGHHAAGE
jgi:transcriptional regulator with XRE-family HTH domain